MLKSREATQMRVQSGEDIDLQAFGAAEGAAPNDVVGDGATSPEGGDGGFDEQGDGARKPTPPTLQSPRAISFALEVGEAAPEPEPEPETAFGEPELFGESERAGELDAAPGGGVPDEEVEVVQPGAAEDDAPNVEVAPEIFDAADD